MLDALYIIIPAYNEEATIEAVASEWHEIADRVGGNSRLVIVDDGGHDSTYAKLLELKKELPRLDAVTKPNSGHGGTILFGYHYALQNNANYIFQTDSDGQTEPGEFWELWTDREKYDIQIGHRRNRQDGFSRIIVTKILKCVLFFSFGLWITDANTPFRLMNAESLRLFLPKIPNNYNLSNVLLTVLYEKAKARIRYVNITFRPRQGGVNSINMRKIFKIGKKAIRDFADLRKSI
jgi:glycosyltransferase involved in cell wall biosynthesis